MASLRRLPRSPYWIACFTLPDGRRTQRSTKATSRGEAQRVANEFEDAAKEGLRGRLTEFQARKVITDIYAISNKSALPSSTIRDFFTSWLKRKELEATEPTHDRYTTAINHLLEFLGSRATNDLSHLNSKEISAFRDALAKRLSPGSINITLKIIRTALSQARREGTVDTNEAGKVSLIKISGREEIRRAFTLTELKAILSVADIEWRGMILMGVYTGLRLSDIAGLTWANINLERGELNVVTGKTGRRQILPLAKSLVTYLTTLPSKAEAATPLFPETSAARQRSKYGGTLSNRFYQILVSAGLAVKREHKKTKKGRSEKRILNELSFHCLRHTATSLLKNAGVSDVVTRDIIGHESEAVSRNYTHIEMDTKRKAVDAMPDVTDASAQQP